VATRIILLAAAVALAAPLGAAPVLAQGNGSNTTGSYDNSDYRMDHKKAEGGETSQHGGHHHAAAARAHGASHGKMAMRSVPAGSESTNQLNEMSLAAAKQGQSFAPSPPAASGAPKKKM
jgi:hypothetical protein